MCIISRSARADYFVYTPRACGPIEGTHENSLTKGPRCWSRRLYGGRHKGGSQWPIQSKGIGKEFGEERWGTNRSKPLSRQQIEPAQESPFDAAHTCSNEGIRTCLLLLLSLPPLFDLLQVQVGEETYCPESLGVQICCLTFLLTHSRWLACMFGDLLCGLTLGLLSRTSQGPGESDSFHVKPAFDSARCPRLPTRKHLKITSLSGVSSLFSFLIVW